VLLTHNCAHSTTSLRMGCALGVLLDVKDVAQPDNALIVQMHW